MGGRTDESLEVMMMFDLEESKDWPQTLKKRASNKALFPYWRYFKMRADRALDKTSSRSERQSTDSYRQPERGPEVAKHRNNLVEAMLPRLMSVAPAFGLDRS